MHLDSSIFNIVFLKNFIFEDPVLRIFSYSLSNQEIKSNLKHDKKAVLIIFAIES